MAEAFPNSRFFGFDYHDGSIEAARKDAKAAGSADRVTFDVHSAKTYPGKRYDLVCFFDCLHDMGDPVGAHEACPRDDGGRRHLHAGRTVCQ